MESQVRNAIQIAWNPTADPNFKGQAFEFINQLRSEPTGWQPCVQLFLQAPKLTEVVRLTSLEILCNALQNGYLDPQSISYVKNVLLDYTKSIYGNTSNIEGTDDAGIQNKLAQSFTYLFTSTYKDSWLDYFDNLLDLTNGPGPCDHLPGVIFYLRALSSVSDEIADVVVSRSPESIKRNNELKDLIRTRHATKVASSWQHILERWRVESTITINMCLKVISQWVSWIDISLVVNDQMIGLLLHFIGQSSIENTSATNEDTRNPAMSTLTEIVSKKMAMPAKIELITYLNLGDIIKQLVESPQLSRLRSTSSYDTDLAESIARLTNVAFLDIVKTLNTEKLETQSRQQADVLMHKFLPSILRFFSDEYDEICSTVIPSLTELLAFFRKASTNTNRLEAQYYNLLEPILNAIILKMRYDETSSWGAEDDQTDEAEFQELRKRLQVLQRSIAAIADSLYIDTLSGVARNAFDSFSQQDGRIDWRDLNLALHEMYLLGELTAKTGSLYLKSQPASRAAEALIPLMSQMVNSGVAQFAHPAIQLQFMEICVRYCSFFEVNSQFIPGILEAFVTFVHHDHIRVRTRSWYLFQRFVKHLRAQLGNVAPNVIEAIADLLPITARVPTDIPNEEMSSDDTSQNDEAVFTSQLYLFEAVGCIYSTPSVPAERQVFYAHSIVNPLFADIERHLGNAKSHDRGSILRIHHIIMALATLARGTSDWQPGVSSSGHNAPAPEVAVDFERTAEAILVALETLSFSIDIRTAARFAFSRLVGVIGVGILPQLPRWIDGLLSHSSTNDEIATFLRLLDQVVFAFKSDIANILDSLLNPLLQRVFTGLETKPLGTDDEIERSELCRELLNFLLVILHNDLGSVLVSPTNQQMFDPLINTCSQFAKSSSDLPTAKLAFTVFSRMSSYWGPGDIRTPIAARSGTKETAPPISSNPLPGFDNFMLQSFMPLCWALPIDPSFNTNDPQAHQVTSEIAGLLKVLWHKLGDRFTSYTREMVSPGLGDKKGEQFLAAVETMEERDFRRWFQKFVQP